jgi:predicted RNase H-like HicB family nuclease
MPREIVFAVEADPADGGFVASALGHGITTQAESEEELREMILDAVRCHFDNPEEMPKVVRLHFIREELLTVGE